MAETNAGVATTGEGVGGGAALDGGADASGGRGPRTADSDHRAALCGAQGVDVAQADVAGSEGPLFTLDGKAVSLLGAEARMVQALRVLHALEKMRCAHGKECTALPLCPVCFLRAAQKGYL